MASAARSCAVCCFAAADEVAPTDTLRVLRLQRLRLRRAATGCLDPIFEEQEEEDDDVPAACSPGAYTSSSSSAVDLAQSHR
nr:uncharacterized protein LOC127330779 [Lolium perenne]